MLPLWVFFIVAAAIALAAFAVGQVAPGLGVAFVAGVTTLWMAYSASQARKAHPCSNKQ